MKPTLAAVLAASFLASACAVAPTATTGTPAAATVERDEGSYVTGSRLRTRGDGNVNSVRVSKPDHYDPLTAPALADPRGR